jgi:predicted naringenin-chalcone synthase
MKLSVDSSFICENIIRILCLKEKKLINFVGYARGLLEKYANLSAASVPFMFHQFMQEALGNKKLSQSLKGSYGIMLSFGVGFSGSAGLIGFR